MTHAKFSAILAKNNITRQLKRRKPNYEVILAELKVIEEYIGTWNQPSVQDIFDEYDI